MFSQLDPVTVRRQRWMRMASVVAHGLVLAWFLHEPEPMLLNPVSVALGKNGNSITRLLWPSKNPDDSTHSSSDAATERYRRQRLGHEKLSWKAPSQLTKLPLPQKAITRADAQDKADAQTLSALGHGVQAGLPYGTLTNGRFYGDELRPALPIVTSDPVVYPWQLPEAAGNEVIEITIDESGQITRKIVLQSLGPEIDSRCLAALDNWRFHPATHNGSPIASKQDAIFPFKARG